MFVWDLQEGTMKHAVELPEGVKTTCDVELAAPAAGEKGENDEERLFVAVASLCYECHLEFGRRCFAQKGSRSSTESWSFAASSTFARQHSWDRMILESSHSHGCLQGIQSAQ